MTNLMLAAVAAASIAGTPVANVACPIEAEVLSTNPPIIALNEVGIEKVCGEVGHGDAQTIYCKAGDTTFLLKVPMEPNACLKPN